MDTLALVIVCIIIGGIVGAVIVAVMKNPHDDEVSDLKKTKKGFRSFLKKIGVQHPRRKLKYMMKLVKINFEDPKTHIQIMKRIMKGYSSACKYLDENSVNLLDIVITVSKDKNLEDKFTVPEEDFDKFYRSYGFIVYIDKLFDVSQMLTAYKVCKQQTSLDFLGKKEQYDLLLNKKNLYEIVDKKFLSELVDKDDKMAEAERSDYRGLIKSLSIKDLLKNDRIYELFKIEDISKFLNKREELESFARAWVDQENAHLDIEFDTAMEFISKGRNFSRLVNLDILAKRAGIDIDEENLINAVDDEGLSIIIHSLIRAKYEGVYLSDFESRTINKANVVDYADSFKVTIELLKDLYTRKRDVKRFTDVMIRAHNAGVNINFSMTDLFSMTDEQFDVLVSNIIKASNKGISIDQNDLIRQNIQGNDVTQLVKALIKANEYNLDLTPDELMNYISHTHSDVVKFVKAYHFAIENNLPSEDGTPLSKDHLVEYSRPEADLYDYVRGLKRAIDVEKKCIEQFEQNKADAISAGIDPDIVNRTRPSDYDRGINYNNLKAHFIKFGSVLPLLDAMDIAARQGLDLDFKTGSMICASPDWNLSSAIQWALRPYILKVQPEITCICKEGIQITPIINATVRGKLPLILSGYGEDILFKRINEAATMELESAIDLDYILQSLPDISQRVLHRVNEEQKSQEIKTGRFRESELNNVCRYDLLDINITDVMVGQNVKSELNLREAQIKAEIQRLKAEADRAKAEADIRIAMVHQYKEGIKPNFNELHKAMLLADNADTITSGYEKLPD